MEAWVIRADGETPTVPRWNANKMPLSNRVADEINAFRGELRKAIADCKLQMVNSEGALRAWSAKRRDCGKANAAIILKTHLAQHELSEIPTDEFVLVEELVELNKGRPR